MTEPTPGFVEIVRGACSSEWEVQCEFPACLKKYDGCCVKARMAKAALAVAFKQEPSEATVTRAINASQYETVYIKRGVFKCIARAMSAQKLRDLGIEGEKE